MAWVQENPKLLRSFTDLGLIGALHSQERRLVEGYNEAVENLALAVDASCNGHWEQFLAVDEGPRIQGWMASNGLISNVNLEGCNQHTGPNCAKGGAAGPGAMSKEELQARVDLDKWLKNPERL